MPIFCDSDRRLEGILSGYTDEEPEVLEYKVNIRDEQKVHLHPRAPTGDLPITNPMLPKNNMGSLVYRAGRDIQPILPYRLLFCFTLVARTGVGQGDAFPCIIVLLGLTITPFFFFNIRYVVSFHLFAVKNEVGFSPCYTTWIS